MFTAHGYRSPAGALADLLRWDPRRSRRYVTAAEQVVDRVGLDGETLPARLEATAAEFAAGQISMRHVEVIAALLSTKAAERIPAEKWAAAEEQLAAHAPDYTPAELHTWGTRRPGRRLRRPRHARVAAPPPRCRSSTLRPMPHRHGSGCWQRRGRRDRM